MCKYVERETQKVIAVRTRCPVTQLPNIIGEIYEKLAQYLQVVQGYPSGPPYVAYFNMDMNDLDVEIGFQVDQDYPEKDDVIMSEIPKGAYAETIYTGAYDTMTEGYDTLMKWMAQNKFKGTGIGYEIYLNDPGEVQAEELLTQILFPIMK